VSRVTGKSASDKARENGELKSKQRQRNKD
jgi:hypothetical protein